PTSMNQSGCTCSALVKSGSPAGIADQPDVIRAQPAPDQHADGDLMILIPIAGGQVRKRVVHLAYQMPPFDVPVKRKPVCDVGAAQVEKKHDRRNAANQADQPVENDVDRSGQVEDCDHQQRVQDAPYVVEPFEVPQPRSARRGKTDLLGQVGDLPVVPDVTVWTGVLW